MDPIEIRNLPSFRLDDRLAVITGASEGIGQRLAVAFAQAGARLALVSRDTQRLAETTKVVQEFKAEVRGYQADVRNVEEIQQLSTSVQKEQGTATILVNSAGYPLTRPARKVTSEDWDLVIDIGLKGVFFVCQTFAGMMADQGYGKIINLSSTYAHSVAVNKSVYAIAKAGISQLTRALALEWAPFGIRVNALAPTLTATPTRKAVLENEERLQSIVTSIPLGRYASTDDLVGSALFLASEASDFVTGHTLFVDGGWTTTR